METKKQLRKSIDRLEKDLVNLNNEIKSLRIELWNIKNPQKYNVGDKVIITYINSAGREEYDFDGIIKEYMPATSDSITGYYLVEVANFGGKIYRVDVADVRFWGYRLK